ncbi:hypothetical protein BJ508DRAFT_333056 [Ascobolus immersus RN42]|uniref:Uncharacterized protein n=1 Tax=Ascobolus immersus RN42 TaxID=1160509 RepID=A0A3N4HR09_ASCIM|nr:hypothetical protein BJ508DRAFT_333056 [Ascobolus immersus RN42]
MEQNDESSKGHPKKMLITTTVLLGLAVFAEAACKFVGLESEDSKLKFIGFSFAMLVSTIFGAAFQNGYFSGKFDRMLARLLSCVLLWSGYVLSVCRDWDSSAALSDKFATVLSLMVIPLLFLTLFVLTTPELLDLVSKLGPLTSYLLSRLCLPCLSIRRKVSSLSHRIRNRRGGNGRSDEEDGSQLSDNESAQRPILHHFQTEVARGSGLRADLHFERASSMLDKKGPV